MSINKCFVRLIYSYQMSPWELLNTVLVKKLSQFQKFSQTNSKKCHLQSTVVVFWWTSNFSKRNQEQSFTLKLLLDLPQFGVSLMWLKSCLKWGRHQTDWKKILLNDWLKIWEVRWKDWRTWRTRESFPNCKISPTFTLWFQMTRLKRQEASKFLDWWIKGLWLRKF